MRVLYQVKDLCNVSAARMRATEALSIRIKDLDLDFSAKVIVGADSQKQRLNSQILSKNILFVLCC
jgi:hypothetical protein